MKHNIIGALSLSLLMITLCFPVYGMADDGRFVFSDLTVKDKYTGLVWSREANPAHAEMSWDKSQIFITELNKRKYAGFSDWRCPTKQELQTLIIYALGIGYGGSDLEHYIAVAFNRMGFYDVPLDTLWTSSETGKEFAWGVSLKKGESAAFDKSSDRYLWPVRNVN